MNGALLVDKPSGPTSFDVVARVRRALGRGVKVGHAGTLDPFASGLLLIVAGRATRLVPYLVGLDKRYLATVQLGVRSDTGDREGVLEATGRPPPDAGALAAACAALVGEIEQVPPAASAIHVGGRRSYELARAGHAVELPVRRVTVRRLELVAYDPAAAIAELDVACSKGTYVRALARDLGESLGCGAHCRELRRTGVGAFEVATAGTPEQVERDPSGPWSLTPAAVVSHLPARALSEPELSDVAHGRPLELHGEQGPVRCLHADRLVCVAEPDAGRLRPRVVLEPAA